MTYDSPGNDDEINGTCTKFKTVACPLITLRQTDQFHIVLLLTELLHQQNGYNYSAILELCSRFLLFIAISYGVNHGVNSDKSDTS